MSRIFRTHLLLLIVSANASHSSSLSSLSSSYISSNKPYNISLKGNQFFKETSSLGSQLKTNEPLMDYPIVQLSENAQLNYTSKGIDESRLNYNISASHRNTETKNTIYYSTRVRSKNMITRFFVGDHVTARMEGFHNSLIPFLAKGDGISTEISTQSTNIAASYFKAMPQVSEQNIGSMYQKKLQPLASDTKLGMNIPFLPQIKFFGGYSYNRNMEAQLVKGPSFGFQADLFKYANLNTTIVKPREGKAAAKVLFSFNIPCDRISF